MQATAIQRPPAVSKNGYEYEDKKPRQVSWNEFKRRYLNRADGYKYEWVRGEVIKTKYFMNRHQYYILKNLRELFSELKFEKKLITGGFEAEMEVWFLPENYRRPDLCYFSEEQESRLFEKEQIPQFVIEVISTNDQANALVDKMRDYRQAGVQVIWQIYPQQQEVHVYRGNTSLICKGEDVCTAAPILPEFAISVNDIFRKKK